jgi:hypothetical protein
MQCYQGYLEQGNVLVLLRDGQPVPMVASANSNDPRPVCWSWGVKDRYTEYTAFALLWDFCGLNLARQFYGRFAADSLAHMPIRDGWNFTLTAADIVAWMIRISSLQPQDMV